MPAGIELFNSVLNQLGSPALYSDIFANRPAFGYTGRLFISTDTNEIYRDTGTSWVLISGGGSPVNIYNSNGTLTAARTMTMAGHNLTFEGGASAARLILSANNNVGRIFSFRTAGVERWAFRVDGNETGSNAGADWALRAYNDAGAFIFAPITVRRRTGEIECFADENISAGSQAIIGLYTNTTGTYNAGISTTGGNPQASNFNIFTLANAGNLTFNDSNLVGTTVNVFVAQANNAGTVSFTASATAAIRCASNYVSQLQYNTSAAAVTYTHAANLHLQGIYQRVGGNAWTITNAYQLLINNLNENAYTGSQIILTNRWGIYQDSTLDPNYFGSRVQIASTTSTGETLQVTGTARVTQSAYFATASGSVGVNTTTPTSLVQINQGTLQITGTSQVVPTGGVGLELLTTSAGSFIQAYNRTSPNYIPLQIGALSTNFVVGNVGINASSAAYPLVVTTPAGNPNTISLINNASNVSQLSFIQNGSTTLAYSAIIADGRTTGYIGFKTNDIERMRIFANGNVRIGSTFTDSGQLLQVEGTAIFTVASGVTSEIGLNQAGLGNWRLRNTATSALFHIVDPNSGLAVTIDFNSNFGIRVSQFGTSATRTLAISTGTAPGSSPADCFQLYSADITAGNAAAHFRTENGAVVKIYQETTAVAAATRVGGGGTTITDTDTFGGYTLQQIAQALRNFGLLQ